MTASRRSHLRSAAKTACLPERAFAVYHVLLMMAGKDASPVRIGWLDLRAECGGMCDSTLTRSLDHLKRHGWLTITRGGGKGNPSRYELTRGERCACRDGRGHPMTAAERKRKSRARQRDQADSVTLTVTTDVTLSARTNVTLTRGTIPV